MTHSPKSTSTVLGRRYDVIAPLGHGAAAQVVRVRDRTTAAEYAAKVLRPESVASESTLRRFEDEYRILRGLHHPSLPEVFDYGWDGEASRFMIMELVEGRALDEHLDEHPEDLWVVLYELCEVVSFIHDHNLLHQDLKPSNILVRLSQAFGDDMPLVTLLDFGLTHQRGGSAKGSMVGTPAYMAPEIIRGVRELTRAADHYSLGVTLFELLVGKVPFSGTPKEVFAAHLKDAPKIEHEQIEYTEIYPHVYGLMAKEPHERLEAFEALRRTTIGRMTGGIDAFARAVGIGRVESLGLFPRDDDWTPEDWETEVVSGDATAREELVHLLTGPPGAGKTFVLDRTVAEWKIRGVNVFALGESAVAWGANPLTQAALTQKGYGQSESADFDQAWSLVNAGSSGTALVIDDAQALSPVELRFFEYVVTRLDLERASDGAIDVTIAVASERPGLPFTVRSELVRVCHVLESSSGHAGSIGDQIGQTIHREDSRRLEALLRTCLPDFGTVIDGLKQNIAAGRMRYLGGAWQVGDLSFAAESPEAPTGVFQVSRLDLAPAAIQVMEWISCDEEGIPLHMLPGLARASDTDIDAALSALGQRRMIGRRSSNETECVFLRPRSLRNDVYASIEGRRRSEMHEAIVRAFHGDDHMPPVDRLQRIATHYRALSNWREMARALLAAIDLLRESKSWGLVRELASAGLRDLSGRSKTRLLARRFLKIVVEVEFSVGSHTAVRALVDNYAAESSQPVPLSMMVPYTIALIRQPDLTRLAGVIEEHKRDRGNLGAEPRGRLALCEALLERDRGQHTQALDALGEADRQTSKFTDKIRALSAVTRATVVCNRGLVENEDEIVDEAIRLARLAGDADSLIVSLAVRITGQVGLGKYDEATATLREAMQVARSARLHDRQYALRFKSSEIYYERGDYRRSLRHVERASSLALSMGDRSQLVRAETRIGMNYQTLGLLGNALRYAQAAERMTEGILADVRWKTKLFVWDVLISVYAEDRHSRFRSLPLDLSGMESGMNRAYYEFLVGAYHLSNETPGEAIKFLRRAMEGFERLDVVDDAARCALGIARAALQSGDQGVHGDALDRARKYVGSMESDNLRAELVAGELAGESLFNASVAVDKSTLVSAMTLAEAAGDVIIKMTLCCAAFRSAANSHYGDIAEATFDRYYRCMKTVVAGLGDDIDVENYMTGAGHRQALADYKNWKDGE